jgi:hypothetical protein
MLRWVSRAILAAGALSLVACQSPTTASSTGSVTMTFSPDPVSANPSSGKTFTIKNSNKPDETREYQYVTSFAVKLTNTNKTGATVSAVTIKVQQASGGIVVVPTTGDIEYYTFDSSPDSNKVAANGGSETTQFTVWYSLPSQGREALITINYSLAADDSSGSFGSTGSVRVVP